MGSSVEARLSLKAVSYQLSVMPAILQRKTRVATHTEKGLLAGDFTQQLAPNEVPITGGYKAFGEPR